MIHLIINHWNQLKIVIGDDLYSIVCRHINIMKFLHFISKILGSSMHYFCDNGGADEPLSKGLANHLF